MKFDLELIFDCLKRRTIAIDRDLQLFTQLNQALYMVGMLVSEQNTG